VAERDGVSREVDPFGLAEPAELDQVSAGATTCVEDARRVREASASKEPPDNRASTTKPPMPVLNLVQLLVAPVLQVQVNLVSMVVTYASNIPKVLEHWSDGSRKGPIHAPCRRIAPLG
jgi:hypothetical protein